MSNYISPYTNMNKWVWNKWENYPGTCIIFFL